jgi:hypothetical protein
LNYVNLHTALQFLLSPWFVLIMMLRNFVDIALFAMPICFYIIRFVFSM